MLALAVPWFASGRFDCNVTLHYYTLSTGVLV